MRPALRGPVFFFGHGKAHTICGAARSAETVTGSHAHAPMELRSAVFLDRDDTLIENRSVTAGSRCPGDLVDPRIVRLLPGVAEGLARLKACGYLLVVVSNQGCVARGNAAMSDVEAVNARMRELLRQGGAGLMGTDVDAEYICPYHPGGTVAPWNREHPDRKPSPGMILRAASDLGIDLGRSWMIGDGERDMAAAHAAGIAPGRCLLIDARRTFREAVEIILKGV